MLNKEGNRELAYLERITAIEPIVGSDNCECAMVGGWKAMVRKNTFAVGDICVVFEYDSLLDASNPAFAFMAAKKYRIKPQRYTFGGKGDFVSDCLVMSPTDFGWDIGINPDGIAEGVITKDKKAIACGDGLTEYLNIKYWEVEDNQRKAPSVNKYKKMAQRHSKLFAKPLFRWLMRRDWGKKLLFVFFGKKKDNKNSWISWVVKTDEDRIQSCTYLLNEEEQTPWIATEKIDGTSTTFTMLQNKPKKRHMFVCSRNVVFDTSEKAEKNFYAETDGNVYLEMAEKYNMNEVLNYILDSHPDWKFITIQGETYGGTIQKRKYGDEHKLAIFNFIWEDAGGNHRLNPIEMRDMINDINKATSFETKLEIVPIVNEAYMLPKTCDEVIAYAHGESVIDGKEREGLVFRDCNGVRSFKAVDPDFLIKYHNS